MSDPNLHDPKYWDALVDSYAAQAQPFTEFFAKAALAKLDIGPGTRLIDIATGTGAAAIAAARAGADVVAIDFSEGMVRNAMSHGLSNIDARQMDGEDLKLPDASFDAAVSIFGVMLFPDWRAGLREMHRVTRSGGSAAVVVWKSRFGAAANLLLSEALLTVYPGVTRPSPSDGMSTLSDPDALATALISAGFRNPHVEEVTHSYILDIAAFDDVDRLFAANPIWRPLEAVQRFAVLCELRARAERERVGDVLPIPSTALIVTADR